MSSDRTSLAHRYILLSEQFFGLHEIFLLQLSRFLFAQKVSILFLCSQNSWRRHSALLSFFNCSYSARTSDKGLQHVISGHLAQHLFLRNFVLKARPLIITFETRLFRLHQCSMFHGILLFMDTGTSQQKHIHSSYTHQSSFSAPLPHPFAEHSVQSRRCWLLKSSSQGIYTKYQSDVALCI